MPKYNKKITRLMDYDELKRGIQDLPIERQAFLSLLFFAGCRVSEALALSSEDISCTHNTIFVQFFRLKGSKQTDPQELPRADALQWICEQEGTLFSFTRRTAHRIVKRAFAGLYPHYFRMNRITKTSDVFGDTTVYHTFGICAQSIDHYRGKVDIKRVGKALQEELRE
jgi:integrase